MVSFNGIALLAATFFILDVAATHSPKREPRLAQITRSILEKRLVDHAAHFDGDLSLYPRDSIDDKGRDVSLENQDSEDLRSDKLDDQDRDGSRSDLENTNDTDGALEGPPSAPKDTTIPDDDAPDSTQRSKKEAKKAKKEAKKAKKKAKKAKKKAKKAKKKAKKAEKKAKKSKKGKKSKCSTCIGS